MSIVYIVCARFDRLSIDRQVRFVRPAVNRLKSYVESLNSEIAKLLQEMKRGSSMTSLTSFGKVLCFMIAAVTLVLTIAIGILFSILRKVFFNLLIGWRGLNLGSLSTMFESFMALVEQVTGPLHLPSSLVRAIFYPFLLICQLMDFFHVGGVYRWLTVTCEGAKAPIELFIDSFVLGVVIIFISSNYIFLWEVTFNEMNKLALVKYWMEKKSIRSVRFVVIVVMFALSSTNPFLTVLRFLLSFVNFSVFFENNNATHVLSPACIGIEGFQNQELWLVYATSALVWWLIPPIVYSIAEIVCPKGGFTAVKKTASSFTRVLDSQNVNSHDNPADESGLAPECESEDGFSFDIEIDLDSSDSVSYNSPEDDDDDSIDAGDVLASDDSIIQSNGAVFNNDDEDSYCISEYDGSVYSFHNATYSDSQVLSPQQGPKGLVSSEGVPLATSKSSCLAVVLEVSLQICSYLLWIFSADLVIVYFIDLYTSYCQKSSKLEQMLRQRSNQRWNPHTVHHSLQQFQMQVANNRTRRFFRRNKINVVQTATDNNAVLESDATKLPPYCRLCFMVQEELCTSLRVVYTLRCVSKPISYFVAFLGFSHILTTVGFNNWSIVARKFTLFTVACLGIWTDETYEAYDMEELVREFTCKDMDEAIMGFLNLTIASRVILLQALGEVPTLISIIVINTCEAPLFVFSPKLLQHIPPLLYLNPRAVALDRERKELRGEEITTIADEDIRVEGWAVGLRSLSILLTESRLIIFLFNVVPLTLTILILKGLSISALILVVLLSATLPYYVGSTLTLLLYIGKRLGLTDEDFYIVFGSWMPRPFEFCQCRRSQRVHSIIGSDYGVNNNDLPQESIDASYLPEQDENDSISSAYIAALIGDSSSSDGNSSDGNSSVGSSADLDSVIRTREKITGEEFQLNVDSENDLDSIDFNLSEDDEKSSLP
jgi:hypothetical protein